MWPWAPLRIVYSSWWICWPRMRGSQGSRSMSELYSRTFISRSVLEFKLGTLRFPGSQEYVRVLLQKVQRVSFRIFNQNLRFPGFQEYVRVLLQDVYQQVSFRIFDQNLEVPRAPPVEYGYFSLYILRYNSKHWIVQKVKCFYDSDWKTIQHIIFCWPLSIDKPSNSWYLFFSKSSYISLRTNSLEILLNCLK